jgi:hypothetical protein
VIPTAVGQVFNARMDGARLLMEAWIDTVKAQSTDEGRQLLERVNAGEPVEVSTGLLVVTEEEDGEYEDEPYSQVWMETFPDHLALLNDGQEGACSYARGCGLRAASRYRATDKGIEVMPEPKKTRTFFDWLRDLVKDETSVEQLATLESELKDLKGAEFSSKNKGKIQAIHDSTVALGALCGEPKAMNKPPCKCHQQEAQMEKKDRVKALIAAAKGLFTDADEPRLLTASDEQLAKFEAAAKGKSGGALLTAIIDKIIANKDLPFTEDDRALLESFPEERLVEFSGWSAGDDKSGDNSADPNADRTGKDTSKNKGNKVDNQPDLNPDGTPKAMAANKGGKEPAVKTTEEFLKDAPQEIRDLVARQKQADAATRARLEALMKEEQTEFSEDEVKKMPLAELERLVRALGLGASFEGRGLPVDNDGETSEYIKQAPPNGYQLALDARKPAAK